MSCLSHMFIFIEWLGYVVYIEHHWMWGFERWLWAIFRSINWQELIRNERPTQLGFFFCSIFAIGNLVKGSRVMFTIILGDVFTQNCTTIIQWWGTSGFVFYWSKSSIWWAQLWLKYSPLVNVFSRCIVMTLFWWTFLVLIHHVLFLDSCD